MREANSEFESKLSQYNRLMKFAAWRYYIPGGILEEKDLYQEALVILNSVFLRYSTKDDREFRKLFKTELWHGLSNVSRSFRAAKRDYRVSIQVDFKTSPSSEIDKQVAAESMRRSVSPEDDLLTKEEYEAVGDLIDCVISVLDDDAIDVFEELLDPTPWEEIPDVFKVPLSDFGCGTRYNRTPKKIPRHVIADMLGMTLREVRSAKSRIAKEIILVAKLDNRLARLAKARIVANKDKKNAKRN